MHTELSLSQVKKIELDILIALTDFCDKHNIKYYLAYGTLIGAVRHGGFIPWDDDIDVVMLRDDYERLNHLLTEIKVREDLDWISLQNGTWNETIGKLINTNTEAYSYRAKTSVWVDVFPIDNYEEAAFKKNKFMRAVHIAKNNNKFRFCKKDFAKYILRFLYFWKSLDSISRDIDNRAKNHPFSGKLANMAWPGKKSPILDASLFDGQSEITFEGHVFKTFKNVDLFLKTVYGDYMKLPPESQRQTHGLKAWWIGNGECPF